MSLVCPASVPFFVPALVRLKTRTNHHFGLFGQSLLSITACKHRANRPIFNPSKRRTAHQTRDRQ
ncbi:hypothetical protein [Caudoviricetes sp.]|nr:hypothetical protein [Caudoviricetes sp.]